MDKQNFSTVPRHGFFAQSFCCVTAVSFFSDVIPRANDWLQVGLTGAFALTSAWVSSISDALHQPFCNQPGTARCALDRMPGAVALRGAAGSQEVGRSFPAAACERTVVDPEVGLSYFEAQLDGRVVSVGPIVRATGCARIGVAAKRNGVCFA